MTLIPWRVRSFFWRNIRRLRHAGGDFAEPENSERARALSSLWDEQWPARTPKRRSAGADLYGHRWVRFHSLPESKRYADTEAETQEILRRHFAILRQLTDDSPAPLTIIAADWNYADSFGGWTKTLLPDAWAWTKCRDFDAEPDDPWEYVWVASRDLDELDPLLRAVADERACLTIAPADLSWLYIPYDGGGDVYARTMDQRDELKERYSDWLSAHPEGL